MSHRKMAFYVKIQLKWSWKRGLGKELSLGVLLPSIYLCFTVLQQAYLAWQNPWRRLYYDKKICMKKKVRLNSIAKCHDLGKPGLHSLCVYRNCCSGFVGFSNTQGDGLSLFLKILLHYYRVSKIQQKSTLARILPQKSSLANIKRINKVNTYSN